MLRINRILFPTDGSDAAATAFLQAAALAEWHDAELHLFNVTDDRDEPDLSVPVSDKALTDWLGTVPGGMNGPNLQALSLTQKQVEATAPAERILAYVEDQDIDLIVMGTHGRRGLSRALLGSVTEAVVRQAPCPVFVVRGDEEAVSPQHAIRRILVPIDFSDASHEAIRHATEIAQTYGAEINLLHVVEEVVYPSAYGMGDAYFPTQNVIRKVEETLADMARDEIGYEHIMIAAVVGYAPLSIIDYAKENEADLIVIATHGRSGFDRMLLGSVAERVIRRAPVPVFIVKPGRKSLVPPSKSTAAAGTT
jgi:nucleotide-binding universal stress UspA family protein